MAWWNSWFIQWRNNQRMKNELEALEEIKRTLTSQSARVKGLYALCNQMEDLIRNFRFKELLDHYKEFESILRSLHNKESMLEALDHKILRKSVFRQLRNSMR